MGGAWGARRGFPGGCRLVALPAGTAVGRTEAEFRASGVRAGSAEPDFRAELVEDLRGELEVAVPREAAMKPNREDEAAPTGGSWEECFEVAVQLALRAGQEKQESPGEVGCRRMDGKRRGQGKERR